MAKRGRRPELKTEVVMDSSLHHTDAEPVIDYTIHPRPFIPETGPRGEGINKKEYNEAIAELIRKSPSDDLLPKPGEDMVLKDLEKLRTFLWTPTTEPVIENPSKEKLADLIDENIEIRIEEIEKFVFHKSDVRVPSTNHKNLWNEIIRTIQVRNLPEEVLPAICQPIASLTADIMLYDDIKEMYSQARKGLNRKLQAIREMFSSGLLSESNNCNSRSFWIDAYNSIYRFRQNIPNKQTYGPFFRSLSSLKRASTDFKVTDRDLAALFLTLLDVTERKSSILRGTAENLKDYELLDILTEPIASISVKRNEHILHIRID